MHVEFRYQESLLLAILELYFKIF